MISSMGDCPLCNAEPPWEFFCDRVATAYLSEEMASRGHAVILARRHVENVSELSRDDSRRFFETYRGVEAALLEVFEADRVIAVKLGLAVPHLHVHLYPVSKEVTRAEVDRILAREARFEATDEEVRDWLERLGRVSSSGARGSDI